MGRSSCDMTKSLSVQTALAHNKVHSDLWKLPVETIRHIYHFLTPVSVLAFRATCVRFRERTIPRIQGRHTRSTTKRAYQELLRKAEIRRLSEIEEKHGLDDISKTAVCSGCYDTHSWTLFSKQQLHHVSSMQRTCLGRERFLRLCEHERYTWEDLNHRDIENESHSCACIHSACRYVDLDRMPWIFFRRILKSTNRVVDASPVETRYGPDLTTARNQDTRLCPHVTLSEIFEGRNVRYTRCVNRGCRGSSSDKLVTKGRSRNVHVTVDRWIRVWKDPTDLRWLSVLELEGEEVQALGLENNKELNDRALYDRYSPWSRVFWRCD